MPNFRICVLSSSLSVQTNEKKKTLNFYERQRWLETKVGCSQKTSCKKKLIINKKFEKLREERSFSHSPGVEIIKEDVGERGARWAWMNEIAGPVYLSRSN